MSIVIDGKAVAETLREQVASQVAELKKSKGITPGLAVVLLGDDPASQVYVRNKIKQTLAVGMQSLEFKLPSDTTEQALLAQVDRLNNNPDVHGVLVQMPLPAHINTEAVIEAIKLEKDVDGFHPLNVGMLHTDNPNGLVPCTPQGCVMLIKEALGDNLTGKHALVVGRSSIVGKPVSALLLRENCTVTIAHSKTRELPELCRMADILVAAGGASTDDTG